MSSTRLILIAFSVVLVAGCESSQNDDEGGQGNFFSEVAASCPVVLDGDVRDASDVGELQQVIVEPLSTDLVVITDALDRTAGPQLVKLHGVTSEGVSAARIQKGIRIISQRARIGYFVPAGESCTLQLADGGLGTYGQILTFQGESLTEMLLREQVVRPAAAGEPCNGDALLGCYQTVQSSAEPIVSPAAVNRFLWKPISESDGNLVVLIDIFGATIVVNGETLRNVGPGNGYGTQARAKRPGCAYGPVATVQVFDGNGDPVKVRGEIDFKITSPCSRVELR